MRICICGGGNLRHVVAGFLAAREVCVVSLLTRRPALWQQQLTISTPDGRQLVGRLERISSEPEEVIADADLVLLCLPGYSIQEVLLQICPFLKPRTPVGSVVCSTGFFFEAMERLSPDTPLFGFQRVPFIARTTTYGHSAALLGYKPQLSIAIEHASEKEPLRATIERLFRTPVQLLSSYYEASLTNSNPLLHPARLYTLWKDWHEGVVYDSQPMFYEMWTEEASELLIALDCEFFHLLRVLPVREGSIPTILDYYESTDAASLTRKLRSIEAFKGILAPMKAVAGGFVPDFQSRYFTEDFPFGMRIIQQLARQHQVAIPMIDKVLMWGMKVAQ